MSEDNYIEGIYDFCDGWCEKCPYTSKCSYFATNVKDTGFLSSLDEEKNEEFWKKLHDLFSETYDMLLALAKEHNIDVSDIEKMEISVAGDDDDYDEDFDDDEEEDEDFEEEEDYEEEEDDYDDGIDEVSRKIIYSSEIINVCNTYQTLTEDWFDYSENLIKKKEYAFNNLLEMEIPGIDAEKMFLTINDAIDVVNWYLFLIKERVKKALFDKMHNTEGEENNYNGSAKVALVAIDRCIASWCCLYEQFEETEDKILAILLVLGDLRKKIEEEFTEARFFIREGLDK